MIEQAVIEPPATEIVAAVAQVAASVFAPPLDTPLLHRVEQARDEAGVVRRFVTERRIVFARDGDGYRADVTQTRSDAAAADGVAGMFDAAARVFAGRTLVFRLDRDGRIVAVDDRAARFAELVAAIAGQAAAGRSREAAERAALTGRLAAPLRAMPAERQLAMLGSMLNAAIAADVAAAGPQPPATVRTPVGAIGGAAATIATRRSVTADGAALAVTIEGAETLPSGVAIALSAVRRIDPRTGLVADARDRMTTALPAGGARSIRTTTTTLKPAW